MRKKRETVQLKTCHVNPNVAIMKEKKTPASAMQLNKKVAIRSALVLLVGEGRSSKSFFCKKKKEREKNLLTVGPA